LNGIDDKIATLNGDVETAGSVAKAVKDGIDAVGTGVAQTEAGKAIVSVTQTNGVVVATPGNIKAANVDVEWDTQNPESTTTSVQGALSEIYAKLDENAEAGEIAFYKDVEGVPTKVGTIAADGVTYTLKQGTNTIATMNFALDKVISSGAVIVATGSETDVPEGQTLVAGQKYVRLVIDNSSDGKNIYIAVNELYDDYTFNNGVEITFTENANVVSAEINTGSIAKEKLTTAL
jgi:LysM repeat protein